MVNSIQKGKRGEREWAAYCREQGYGCRRGQQYSGQGGEGEDVIGLPGIWQEVKRDESLNLEKAMVQSETNCADYNAKHPEDSRIPIVAHRKNRRKWQIAMRIDGLVKLLWMDYEDEPMLDAFKNLKVVMDADDWFMIYREWEAERRIEEIFRERLEAEKNNLKQRAGIGI